MGTDEQAVTNLSSILQSNRDQERAGCFMASKMFLEIYSSAKQDDHSEIKEKSTKVLYG